jgi:hypothetical protein
MKQAIDESPEFSLIRDDLPFRLQRRVGLIPEQGLGTVRRAVFFALLTWLPIAVWAVFNERALTGHVDEPLLQHFGIHVRFLIAVPLFIIGEAMMHKLLARLIPYFLTSGLIQDEQQGIFKEIIQSVIRLRNLTKPWLIIIVLILAWTIFKPAAIDDHELNWSTGGFGQLWYSYVSRPIFTILMAAWLWRLALMVILLKRIAGIGLNLVPTHADRAGGLGFMEKLPTAFSLFALAVSSVLASRLAHQVVYHGVHVQSLKGLLAAFLLVIIGLCVAPLLVFIGPLMAAKRQALLEYGTLVGQHGRLARRRWILGETLDDDSLLDAQEIGPVADTLALYDAVKNMRAAPIGKSAILGVALPALIPLVILFSIEVPIKEILTKLLGILV